MIGTTWFYGTISFAIPVGDCESVATATHSAWYSTGTRHHSNDDSAEDVLLVKMNGDFMMLF